VGDQSIEAQRGEEECNEALSARDDGAHAHRSHTHRTAGNLLVEDANVVDRHFWIQLGDGLLDGCGNLQRVHSGARNDGDVALEVLSQWIKNQGTIGVGYRPNAHLIDDANDLHRVSLQREPLTDSIAIRPQLLGKRSIDDGHTRRGLIVVGGKIVARHDARSHRFKIRMINRCTNDHQKLLDFGWRLAFGPNTGALTTSCIKGKVRGDGGAGYTRQRAKFVEQTHLKLAAALVAVALQRRID
jgi:hypothetical protein